MLGTENKRQGLEFNSALTDEGVPIARSCRVHTDQQSPIGGFRPRDVIIYDHTRRTES